MTSEVPTGQQRVRSYIPVGNGVTRRMAEKMDGYPKSMWSEVLLGAPTTAHILGGCAMADNPGRGVVGLDGQLFGHPGLYVADGSVVPVNLAVNPSLTITALAEHIMSQVAAKDAA